MLTYNKLTGSCRAEKVNRLIAALVSQQRFFSRAHESNKNTTKASYEVAMLIAKHGKPFMEGEFIKKAKKMLSLFGSIYLCEQTFSVMNFNKSRLR